VSFESSQENTPQKWQACIPMGWQKWGDRAFDRNRFRSSKNHQEISENNLPILNPTLPVGFDHSSLDILEGIVKVLRKRLDDPSASSPQGALHSNL